jgi:hypothetical protein
LRLIDAEPDGAVPVSAKVKVVEFPVVRGLTVGTTARFQPVPVEGYTTLDNDQLAILVEPISVTFKVAVTLIAPPAATVGELKAKVTDGLPVTMLVPISQTVGSATVKVTVTGKFAAPLAPVRVPVYV